MNTGDRQFAPTLKKLLNERLSKAEEQSLKDEGFNLKSPKRKAAIMIALYKKAASGDLSAIKELRAVLGGAAEQTGGTGVRIVDDIGG